MEQSEKGYKFYVGVVGQKPKNRKNERKAVMRRRRKRGDIYNFRTKKGIPYERHVDGWDWSDWDDENA